MTISNGLVTSGLGGYVRELSTVSESEFNRLGVCLKLYMRKYFEERQARRLADLDVTREMEEEEIQKCEEEFEKGVGHDDNHWDDEEEDTEEEEGGNREETARIVGGSFQGSPISTTTPVGDDEDLENGGAEGVSENSTDDVATSPSSITTIVGGRGMDSSSESSSVSLQDSMSGEGRYSSPTRESDEEYRTSVVDQEEEDSEQGLQEHDTGGSSTTTQQREITVIEDGPLEYTTMMESVLGR
jgi:hypothetical protein